MSVRNRVGRVPPAVLLIGGIAAGGIAGVVASPEGTSASDRRTRLLLSGIGGPVLAGVGLLGAISLEHGQGPFVDRYVVDAAEQVSRRRVDLDWSTRSGRIGMAVSGVGLGLMSTFVAHASQ